jgi:hypothetical protein
VKKSPSKRVPLKKFKGPGSSLADAVKGISEDSGHLLGNVKIQAYVNDICQMMRSLKKKDVQDPEQLLEQMKDFPLSASILYGSLKLK